MARPLRIDVAGGWYHVTNRGNDRRTIFRDERDRSRFLELLAEWPTRFETRLHAYVLMDNHFHLFVETPAANLSQAMQWLLVAYSVWFNRRHRRAGHLFQGRFHAVLVEAGSAAWEVSRYVHLNPVRIRRLGLDKGAQERQQNGLSDPPDKEQVAARLELLRQYRWSSYRVYAGLTARPEWLSCEPILELGGGGALAERQRNYRRFIEETIREGLPASPWERLEAGLILGGAAFVQRMKKLAQGNGREQPQLRHLQTRPEWQQIVIAVETIKQETWEKFRDQRGDWGRDLALYCGRRHGGMSLQELAIAAGGMDYSAVAKAVNRFTQRLARDRHLKNAYDQTKEHLSNVQM